MFLHYTRRSTVHCCIRKKHLDTSVIQSSYQFHQARMVQSVCSEGEEVRSCMFCSDNGQLQKTRPVFNSPPAFVIKICSNYAPIVVDWRIQLHTLFLLGTTVTCVPREHHREHWNQTSTETSTTNTIGKVCNENHRAH